MVKILINEFSYVFTAFSYKDHNENFMLTAFTVIHTLKSGNLFTKFAVHKLLYVWHPGSGELHHAAFSLQARFLIHNLLL